ncbi:CobW family GTP-binding protein [Butyrivibrio sp. YAB3001]|uniref:CobW family GTP-binding protein n=1 Tax=Butyrivibrio sp. YAB3001 TaxID=1520812 RepID=UPI0008F64BD4|nr:CobW family GTP-binding protein [Butyrivibrio sp. YAB3001]SFB75262.1 GTPase, G3E family [Butyrivibrio sp. YAB3001]
MTKIDIISGFLGAGKTTLIKKLLKEALNGTKVVLIENEFGEIGIDGGFLKEAGIEITEMNSGCICCSLVGDFETSLKQVMDQYAPERILIEPSGVGKLSDVMRAIQNIADGSAEMELNSAVTVVDVSKAKVYIKNFGEFFINQIENAGTIILTRTDKADQKKIEEAVELIRKHNDKATIITTPLDQITGKEILDTFEGNNDLEAELLKQVMEEEEHHHHHHHDHGSHKVVMEDGSVVYRAHHDDDEDEDEHEHHHHHHDEDEDEHEHEHHHHHHDEDEDEHEHHHHHHDEDEDEHEHHHHHHDEDEDEHEHHHHHHDEDEDEHEHHHHHHDEDEDEHEHHHHDHDHAAHDVFVSWGMETPLKYTKDEIEKMLSQLEDEEKYGIVLRTKGVVPTADGKWIEFDYVPGEADVRDGAADVTGKFCVIGSGLKEENLEKLFRRVGF